jgi:hypothetical protein
MSSSRSGSFGLFMDALTSVHRKYAVVLDLLLKINSAAAMITETVAAGLGALIRHSVDSQSKTLT